MDPSTENLQQHALSIPRDCQTRVVLGHVTNKWGTLALLALVDGPRRWSELKRALEGCSEKMLAQCLKSLVSDGFVVRTQRPTMPPHVEYSLTVEGREVSQLVMHLVDRIAVHTGEFSSLAKHSNGPNAPTESSQH